MLRFPCLFVLCLVSAVGAVTEESHLSVELMTKFQHWMTFHGKDYDSHDERSERLRVWIENDGKKRDNEEIRALCRAGWHGEKASACHPPCVMLAPCTTGA
jgi:hypothetical protein